MFDQLDSGARPLTKKGMETRARIVAVAAELIFERGVAGTSIDDIRRATGVSGSQMTHYFEDKHTLVRAVITHQANLVLTAHAAAELGRLDSFEALRHWADMVIEIQRRRAYVGGCRLGSLAAELADRDPEFRLDLVEGFGRWQALLRNGLEMMRARGELRAEADPDRLALALLTAVQGGMLLTKTQRDLAPLETALTGALFYVRSFAAQSDGLTHLPEPPAPPV